MDAKPSGKACALEVAPATHQKKARRRLPSEEEFDDEVAALTMSIDSEAACLKANLKAGLTPNEVVAH